MNSQVVLVASSNTAVKKSMEPVYSVCPKKMCCYNFDREQFIGVHCNRRLDN